MFLQDTHRDSTVDVEEDVSVEYVSEQLDVSGAGLEAFSDVFARFQLPPDEPTVSIIFLVLSVNNFRMKYPAVENHRLLQRRNYIFRR